MRVGPSAFKHGVEEADIEHAYRHHLVFVDFDPESDPPKVLLIGPDRTGNLLEVLLLVTDDEDDLSAIHAMRLRAAFYPLLPDEGGPTS